MNFITNKLSGLRKRWKDLGYGILYLRSGDFAIPDSLWMNRAFKRFQFAGKDTGAFVYEFNEICINDCYELKMLKTALGEVRSIVDIGANQGLFLVAARKRFSKASLTGYEPNPGLKKVLGFNAASLDGNYYSEAVTKENCRIKLNFGESDLHTTSEVADNGDITGTSLRDVIQRQGGSIDILKLDCEGAEWALFEDVDAWKAIAGITMEYHLWARPGYTERHITDALTGLGFTILAHHPLSPQFGLITAVRKDRMGNRK